MKMKIYCPKCEMKHFGRYCRRCDMGFCQFCYGEYCPICGYLGRAEKVVEVKEKKKYDSNFQVENHAD